jgi:hypothetical protein
MNWKEKAIAATRGTQLGAIMACALDQEIPAPHFNGKASVTSDGFLMCNFTRANGEQHMGALVGAYNDLERNAIGLAAHLKLTDGERREFTDALVGWIGVDYSGGAAKRLRDALTARRH